MVGGSIFIGDGNRKFTYSIHDGLWTFGGNASPEIMRCRKTGNRNLTSIVGGNVFVGDGNSVFTYSIRDGL